MLFLLILFLIGLSFGSFLNVIAYRVLSDKSLFGKRSFCPKCEKNIYWYDNIPIVSWFVLCGKCRFCKNKISFLYPFIELLTAFIFIALFIKVFFVGASISDFIFNQDFFLNYFLFNFYFFDLLKFIFYLIPCFALILSVRTDLESLVIPQIFSIYLVPVGIIFSLTKILEINFIESILASIVGYFSLWTIGKIFKFSTGKVGIGEGDMELLAMIGAFFGLLAVWCAILIGSISGLIIGGIYILLFGKSHEVKIPFGPFLALGTFIYFFFTDQVMLILVG